MEKHYEIEHKYLIRYPDAAMLAAQPGAVRWDIEQTYLAAEAPWDTRRIRKVTTQGREMFFRTFKKKVTTLSAEEDEAQLTPEEYAAFAAQRRPGSRVILKTRYRIPYEGHKLEFDLYPFWNDRAILEIELENEDIVPAIPEWVKIIREVTDDLAYKNSALADSVPYEEI